MKRQIANPTKYFVILAVFMLFAFQAVTYGQTVSIDPATIESPAAGEQLTLNIKIAGGANVAGYQVTVTFDQPRSRMPASQMAITCPLVRLSRHCLPPIQVWGLVQPLLVLRQTETARLPQLPLQLSKPKIRQLD